MSSDTETQNTKQDDENIRLKDAENSKQDINNIEQRDAETSEQSVEITKREDEQEDLDNTNEWVKWIEDAISKDYFKYYEHKQFGDIREIGSGGFGKVFRANWREAKNYHVLKSFYNLNNASVKEIVHEIKLHRDVHFHDNIIGFFGVTKFESENQTDQLKNYMLVMEYANGGTLRKYLKKNSEVLTWDAKHNLGYQLASAVSFLHTEGIVHRDLHSNNILVHNDTIKLSDFGLSRRMEETTKNRSKLFGVVPYVDPKKFDKSYGKKNKNSLTQIYSLDKKSDVYSVGVLLWEISSCRPPFVSNDHDNFDIALALQISQGLRETPITGTPNNYVNLYVECWDENPDERPSMSQVSERLNVIRNNAGADMDYYEEPEVVSSEMHSSALISSNNSSSLQGELSNIIQNFDNIDTKELKELESEALMQHYKEILEFVEKITNEGKEPKLRKKSVLDYINVNSINSNQVYNFLLTNQQDPDSIFLLGYFNSLGIETVKDYKKAYDYYINPLIQDHKLTSYYIGLCHLHGYGTEKDEKLAFEFFEKSANKGCAAGQISVGYCYFMGTGVKKDLKMAVSWYEKAACNGNMMAKYNLGLLYLNGNGINKDHGKAFELFKESADGEYSGGISMLGYCYDTGIGTVADKQKAFEQYNKAAELDNNVAQFNLARKYKRGEGIEKDIDMAIYWYEQSVKYGNQKAQNKLEKLVKRPRSAKRNDSCKTM